METVEPPQPPGEDLQDADALMGMLDELEIETEAHLGHQDDHDGHHDEESVLKDAIVKLKAAGVSKPVPLIVLSGFLGAGKTTLLKRMLEMEHGHKVAVIVNDMADVNIDAELVKRSGSITASQDELVEMSNGCICCTLRGDLIDAVSDLIIADKYDYMVIESTGIGEPMPVAATFAAEDAEGRSLSPFVKIDSMVTVLDGPLFARDLKTADSLADRRIAAHDADDRTIADLLVDQIEFADLIILNKTDLLTDGQQARIGALCAKMNPAARVLPAHRCAVPMGELFDTGRFDFEKAQDTEGWKTELQHNHAPETEEYGIGSVTFQDRRPFHPRRWWDFMENLPKNILRAKGFFWVAGINDVHYEMSVAGGQRRCEPSGMWESAVSETLPDPIPSSWDPEFLDRKQVVVLIGEHLDKDALLAQVSSCIVTDEEWGRKESLAREWQEEATNPWVPMLVDFLGGEEAEVKA